ncbi:hypothetical protein [Aeromicrobium ginsengisoli]|uniref:Uncharacterized protein n=1 Tax=Aeromicrobium ginsengisoli TaxID=363867 RepID=A0A5M4FEH2_9ACTN|nr:hypothetical protein [Aeromicrobium ginsengisoli]KAA1397745.1 hypothetical protein ESP70_010360 [Aeromicrobium ginsengisoli]
MVLIATLASCNDSEPDPVPTATKSATTTPTSTKAAWESKYNAKEIAAYKEALARYEAYLSESQPVWAAGRATPGAKKLFQKYYIPWTVYWRQLQQFDKSDIRIARNAKVLTSEPTRVKFGGDGATVTIEQCVDATNIGATQGDKPLKNAFDKPQLNEIIMSQVDGRWYLTQLPAAPKDRPCNG